MIISILWITTGIFSVKIIGIPLGALHLLATITFFVIYDNGAANRLKKQKFKIKGIKNLAEGHTYYYALKYSGFIRLMINLILTSLIASMSLITFLI